MIKVLDEQNIDKVATKKTSNRKRNAYYHAIGKRKTSIASVRLFDGEGSITINGKDIKEYVHDKESLDIIRAPLKITDTLKNYNIVVKVVGGGFRSQADAISLGISKCLLEANMMLRDALKKQGFLTRDSRIVERKKPGLKKARRSPQWSKR